MFTTIVIAALLLVLGIVILAGKGDMLIAGYNTASKEEREKYNIKKLRLLLGLLLIILSAFSFLLVPGHTKTLTCVFFTVVVVLVVATLILANTWAKKKDH